MLAILKTSLGSFTLPELKVKKFTFDNLALQRSAQTSINQVSRLLVLPIKGFQINQDKLNRQVKTSLQRAANQARIITRTVTGNSGGYGAHNVGGSQHILPPYQQHMLNNSGTSSMGLGMGIGAMSRYLGPAVLGYAAMRGYSAFYNGNADAVSNRHSITNVVSDNNKSYSENQKAGKNAYDYLYSESNRLGLDAKDSAQGYAKVLASGQASGLSLETSQKLFTNLSEHSTVLHLDNVKQGRLLYAVGQILAKGQVMSEELKGQIGESSPTLPSYFAKAYAEQTKSNLKGAEAMGALMKAMEKGLVKSDIALRALELASIDAKPKLALSTTTSAAEANRARNVRSYTMNEASIHGVEDGLFRVNKAIRIFAEDLAPMSESMAISFAKSLGATADFTLGLRGMAKGIPGAKESTMKAANDMPWYDISQPLGPAVSVPIGAYKMTKWMMEEFKTPAPVISPQAYQESAARFKTLGNTFAGSTDKPLGMLPLLLPLPPTQSRESAVSQLAGKYAHQLQTINSPTNITSTFNITSTAQDVESLSRDLEPHINNLFRLGNSRLLSESLAQFPMGE
jgi:hypothetical protein